jgi:putative transcriptional regulator
MEYKCKLKVILAEMDMKHGVFAKKADISPSALSLVINSKTLPSFETTYKICTFLDMKINEIWIKKEPT